MHERRKHASTQELYVHACTMQSLHPWKFYLLKKRNRHGSRQGSSIKGHTTVYISLQVTIRVLNIHAKKELEEACELQAHRPPCFCCAKENIRKMRIKEAIAIGVLQGDVFGLFQERRRPPSLASQQWQLMETPQD